MTLPVSLVNRIDIAPELAAYEATILSWLEDGWDNQNATILEMLLKMESDDRNLVVVYEEGSSGRSLPGMYTIYIDPNSREFSAGPYKKYMFDTDGTLFEVSWKRSFFHEMVHAVLGLDDGPTGAPYGLTPYTLATSNVVQLRGDTATKENEISASSDHGVCKSLVRWTLSIDDLLSENANLWFDGRYRSMISYQKTQAYRVGHHEMVT